VTKAWAATVLTLYPERFPGPLGITYPVMRSRPARTGACHADTAVRVPTSSAPES
jgi:hypothetical protein